MHIDVPPTGLLIGRNETTGRVKYDFEVQGQMVGISKKFNSADKITKNKVTEQKRYVQKHENRWFFNEDGKSTPYHEMGHVYEDVKGLPDGFERDAERWWHECKCDMLKNPKEAWSEAWGAYHTGNEELPDYIAKYIEEATAKPIAKKFGSDIIDSGAISGALTDKNDPWYIKREKHASIYYESIRNSKKEPIVKTISRNSGFSESYISKVYDHIFTNEYELNGRRQHFAPDYDMAESFKRLREGRSIQEHDVILLKHEHLEYGLMNRLGLSYEDAHNLAQTKYSYKDALDAFKEKNHL